MKTVKIYLSSTKYSIFNLNGRFWKDRFQNYVTELNRPKTFNVRFIDPFKYSDSDDPLVAKIDKRLINRCNYFVCYLNKISIGTVMELMYQYDINNIKRFKTINNICVLIDPTGKHRKHPWIKHHCENIFDDVESAAWFIVTNEKLKLDKKEEQSK